MEKSELCCELCKVKLLDARSHQAHLIGKRHQLAVHNCHLYDKRKRCGVFIGGLPNMVSRDELFKFLGDLGITTHIHIPETNKYAFVDFKEEKTAQELIKKRNLYFMGKTLFVKSRLLKKEENDKEPTNSEMDFDTINESLKNLTNFDEQMKALLLHLQPNQQQQMWQYKVLCEDLQKCLVDVFPGCRVYPFGSTITRLNFQSSDVDVYVDVTGIPNFKVETESSSYVKKARNALPKYRLFSNLVAIPKAKTPIVKCVHIGTNIHCDFNFKNMLGVCNSYLIKHYVSLAPNLLWVLLIVKYWGRVHEFTGASNKFSNYALIVMFIFFTQHPPFDVESVHDMQTVEGTENMQHGWNGGFTPTQLLNNVFLNKSIVEILQKFFEFYSDFDYNLNVICPFLGKSVPKIDFLKPEILNDSFLLYKINLVSRDPLIVEVPLCVQDPFEHTHNLTQRITVKFVEDFVAQCKHSANILRNSSEQCAILYKLFTDEPSEGKFKFNNQCEFRIDMRSLLQYIENQIPSEKSDKSKEIKRIWYHTINKFVVDVLIKVLKFNVKVLKEEPPAKKFQNNVAPVDSVAFHCTGNYNVWDSRRTVVKDLDLSKTVSVLEREVEITTYIINVLCKNITIDKPIVDFNISLFACGSPIHMEFVITNVASVKGCFKALCVFLTNRLPYLFTIYEEELNRNVLKMRQEKSS